MVTGDYKIRLIEILLNSDSGIFSIPIYCNQLANLLLMKRYTNIIKIIGDKKINRNFIKLMLFDENINRYIINTNNQAIGK